MTKKELSQLYYLNKEVEMWQKELNKIQCKSLIKSQSLAGMPKGNSISDRTGELATDIAGTEAIIREKLVEIQLQRKKIIEYINSIDDSLIRQIIFYRHISCMTWGQVAAHIGNNTSSTIRQIYSRYFREK